MMRREFIKSVYQGGFFLWLYSRLPSKGSLLRQVLKTLTNHRRRQLPGSQARPSSRRIRRLS